MEHTGSTGHLAFLDTLLTIHPSGAYSTELYFKPMAAPIILHYTSSHPTSTKKAVLNGEVQRAIRVSSDHDTTERSLDTITRLFAKNGYPSELIKRTIQHNKYHKKHGSRNNTTLNNTRHNNDLGQIYMRLPYINETIVKRVNAILRNSKTTIKPVWINNNSLKKILVSSAFINPPCPSGNKICHTCKNGFSGKCSTKNTVYRVTCRMCEAERRVSCYIGESHRPVRYRFNEHLSDARLRKMDTPLGEHILQYHTDITNTQINSAFSIKLLDTGKDCADVKIKESIHIRNTKPSMNTMTSSWPLTR